MRGQWIGGYGGDQSGLLMVDADETDLNFLGGVLLDFEKMDRPWPYVQFTTPSKDREFALTLPVNYLIKGQLYSAHQCSTYFQGETFAAQAEVAFKWNASELQLSWRTDNKISGSTTIERLPFPQTSNVPAHAMTWDEFKKYASQCKHRSMLYRGQQKPWRLRTGFHRTGRAFMPKFFKDDILALHRHLSARTRHFFNLNNPDEQGAFLNLIQHHGYPTPILDFTYSPFVAAYFAFADAEASSDQSDAVRIYMINREPCLKLFPPVPTLTGVGPHFSLMEFSSVENERMIPQQAVSAVTNIDDIETYLLNMKGSENQEILTCFDIPRSARAAAMSDLRLMGITAGSLFPGIDGICRELKDQFFIRE